MAKIQHIVFALLIAGIAASLTALILMAASAGGSQTTVYHEAQLAALSRGGVL